MSRGQSHKIKTWLFSFIKYGIVIAAFYVIIKKLTQNENLNITDFLQFWPKNDLFSSFLGIFLLFLTIFNWFFEFLKWRNLAFFTHPISIFEAAKQSLTAHTLSLLTPNRIGEFGVKPLFFSKHLRRRILLLTFLGNLAQLTATLIFGSIGLILFLSKYETQLANYNLVRLIVISLMTLSLIMLVLYRSGITFKGFSLERIIDFIVAIPQKIHAKTLIYAMLRYLIFSFQFCFLLHLFGAGPGYWDSMIIITSMYLLASIIPAISAFDPIVKGGIAIYLFGFAGVDEVTVLCATTLMWILNTALPALAGSLFVIRFDHRKILTAQIRTAQA
jgi:hypothetical protein